MGIIKPIFTLIRPLVSAAVRKELEAAARGVGAGGSIGSFAALVKQELARLGAKASSIYTASATTASAP